MEQGGLNLFGFVLNNPIGRWDYLGMDIDGEGKPYYEGQTLIRHQD